MPFSNFWGWQFFRNLKSLFETILQFWAPRCLGAQPSLRNIKYTRICRLKKFKNFSPKGPRKNVAPAPLWLSSRLDPHLEKLYTYVWCFFRSIQVSVPQKSCTWGKCFHHLFLKVFQNRMFSRSNSFLLAEAFFAVSMFLSVQCNA